MAEIKSKRRRPPKFELIAGNLCLDFINTLDDRPSEQPKELLPNYYELARFGEDTGILTPNQLDFFYERIPLAPEDAEETMRRARKLREALHDIFLAVMNGRKAPQPAMDRLNANLHDAALHSWYFGMRADQRQGLARLEAPNFTLPDLNGKKHSHWVIPQKDSNSCGAKALRMALIEMGLGVSRFGRTSVTFDQVVFCGGRCVASSQSVSVLEQATRTRIEELTQYFMNHGLIDGVDAAHRVYVAIGHIVQKQAYILAFSDTFYTLGAALIVALFAGLLLKKPDRLDAGGAH